MSRPKSHGIIAVGLTLVLMAGCAPTQPFYFFETGDLSHYIGMATKIETPDVKQASLAEVTDPLGPLTLSNPKYDRIWDLPLEDAIHITLENSKIMRTLGGRFASQGGTRPQVSDASTVLLDSPAAISSVYDPAIVESNPTSGVEGALSPYDAQLASSFTWEHVNQPQNVVPGIAFANTVEMQDIDTFQTSISKLTGSGGTFSLTNTAVYTDSNSLGLLQAHDNSDTLDFGFQQRLLRGGGLFFNEIHGPLAAGTAGAGAGFNGVVIARINMDMSLADFEVGVRNLVSDVENAYWELYFAYRALNAAKVGRDSALQTWRQIHALYVVNAKGGEADKEAQSRDQYFNFKGQVEQALTDLYRTENRLRFLMGLAATDGRLIRPKDEPTTAKVVFDFHDVHCEGLTRSPELRKEKWRIKQFELELLASKNLLLPNLDFNADYKLYGLGDTLLNPDGTAYTGFNSLPGSTAAADVVEGKFPNYNLGLTFSMPFGFRRELTTIRNQQLLLARERSVLQDQELELSHEITDAVRNVDTQYHLMQTNFNRRLAAEQEVVAVKVAYETGTITLDVLLTAQQERSVAEAAYYRSLVDYNRAISQIHFVAGSLLEFNDVFLAEGPWPCKAYFDAHRLARQRDAGFYMNYGYSRPDVFSRGETPQFMHGPDAGGIFNSQGAAEPIGPANPQLPTPATGPAPQSNKAPDALPQDSILPDSESSSQVPSSVRKPRSIYDGPRLGYSPTTAGVRQASFSAPDQTGGQWRSGGTANSTGGSVGAAAGGRAWQASSGNATDPDQATAQTDRTASGWQAAGR